METHLYHDCGTCSVLRVSMCSCFRRWWRGDCWGKQGSTDETLRGTSFWRRCGSGRMSESSHLDFWAHLLCGLHGVCWVLSLCCRKGDEIYHQLRKLGASLDWSRACFTMDPVRVESHMFLTLRFNVLMEFYVWNHPRKMISTILTSWFMKLYK